MIRIYFADYFIFSDEFILRLVHKKYWLLVSTPSFCGIAIKAAYSLFYNLFVLSVGLMIESGNADHKSFVKSDKY